MSTLRRTLSGVLAGAAVAVALVLIAGGSAGSVPRSAAPHAALSTGATAAPASLTAGGGSPRQRLTVAQVERAFVRCYAAYLDGSGSLRALPYASVTAREQARAGGLIPPAFRDGPLRVKSARGQGTAYSAQATVTVANRSESYVLALQLLRTQLGWQVAQLQSPDLSIDDHTRPVSGPAIPPAAQRASAAFAIAYTAFRSQTRARPPAQMTATARSELSQGQDPLAASGRHSGQPRVVALRYGPLQGTEFAVTATVRTGGALRQFTVLMVKQPAGWECDAFL